MTDHFDFLPIEPALGLPRECRCDVFVLSDWPEDLKHNLVCGFDPGVANVGFALLHYPDLLHRRLEEGRVVGLGVLGWANPTELLKNYATLINCARMNLLLIWSEMLTALEKLGAKIELVVIEEQPYLKGRPHINRACVLCAQTLQDLAISRGLCCLTKAAHGSKEDRCRNSPIHQLQLDEEVLIRGMYSEIQQHVLDASWLTAAFPSDGEFTKKQKLEMLAVRRLCAMDGSRSMSGGSKVLDACLKLSSNQMLANTSDNGSLKWQIFLKEHSLGTGKFSTRSAARSKKRPRCSAQVIKRISSP